MTIIPLAMFNVDTGLLSWMPLEFYNPRGIKRHSNKTITVHNHDAPISRNHLAIKQNL